MNQTLRELELFKELNDEEVQYLASISVLRSYDKDSIVFYSGEESSYLHVLIEGSVKIYKSTQKNNEITLKKITRPSLIAELSNFKHIPYPSNCATLSDSKILLVDYKKFEEIILQNSSYLRRFMDSMAESLVDLNRVVATFALDATAKVAKYIFEFEEDFKKNTFIQSATLLNMTPETFSRSIKKLKDEGALRDKKTADKEKLKDYF
ncbi:Crp/Fnr family transcriptional regulator [Sulfurospirillum sp. 1612]|uniref:Crp/Fnr family transcriptional regulator n=1 Tax=Sulfurospirillum sp. 1612 TaxID=3094835 RepID=UPI002F950C96